MSKDWREKLEISNVVKLNLWYIATHKTHMTKNTKHYNILLMDSK